MRKNYRRLLVFVLLVAMLATNMLVFAADPTIDLQRYDKVSSFSVFLDISKYGYAECTGDMRLRSGATADLTITLYKSKDKTSWSKVDSWSVSGPSLLTLNDGCCVMSGYYYVAKLTANVYDTSGNFIEDVSLSTNIESY